ncbi:uncharacterized protein OCT59_004792 [Rhizophagus irregularis]|uniref:uncharacterized protein n=1 Tax=Rhizophagus irregularis TaxID=588596 RepID=UPI00332A2225|nr:hypothetical protein OCT59_004792 [Rhizophagus irregularis]
MEKKGENERGKERGKRKGKTKGFGWASEERKTQRFVREGFRRTKTQRFTIGWASVFRRTGKFQDSFGRLGGLPCSEEREISKDSIWWASEERKTKKPRFVRSGGLPKNENPKIRSGGLPKNENPKIRKFGWASEERKPKDKDSFGRAFVWKNQDSIGWSGLPTFGKRRTKIRKIGWASDLWEKRNQDSIGWSGLPTFGKRRTKIRLGCLRCLLKNGKNQRFVSSGGLLKNNQRFVYTNT